MAGEQGKHQRVVDVVCERLEWQQFTKENADLRLAVVKKIAAVINGKKDEDAFSLVASVSRMLDEIVDECEGKGK